MINSEYDFTWEKIVGEMEKSVPAPDFEIFKKTFSLLRVKGNLLVFGYNDKAAYTDFTEKYMKQIYTAACSACLRLAKVKFVPLTAKNVSPTPSVGVKNGHREKYKRGIKEILISVLCLAAAFVLLLTGVSFAVNLNFKENFYSLSIQHTYDNFRVIQLSDLHNAVYGKNNDKLVHRITLLKPDLIVMTGDCLDKNGSLEKLEALCSRLTAVAPTYYIYGNNENEVAFACDMTLEALDEKFSFTEDTRDPQKLYQSDSGLKAALENAGVKVLMNDFDTIEIKSNKVKIFGTLTSNPSAFWPYAGQRFSEFINREDSDAIRIFLCHEPTLLETLDEEYWGDVIFCGDTHGGVVRLPGVGALYSKDYGLLPEARGHMIYGKYALGESSVIVSSGLTNRGWVRIADQPEIVVADINKY